MPASIYHNNNLKGSGSTREYQEPSWMRIALEAGQQRELSPSSLWGSSSPERLLSAGRGVSECGLRWASLPFSCYGDVLHFLLWKRFADILCCHSVW